MNRPPLWILLDLTNYAHRDLHAAGADRVGTITRARLAALREKFKPEHLVACFDEGETFRKAIEPTYKGGRKPKPDGLAKALEDAREACLLESVDVVAVETFEADDAIATLTTIAIDAGRRVVIGSADKDLHQLLEPDAVTQLLAVKRQKGDLVCTWSTASDLFKRYGVRPDQWVDYRAMIGDPSDNVAGIHGVGPKAAARILQTCQTLDGFYSDPFVVDVQERIRTKLFNARPELPKLRQLLELRRDVPLPEGWHDLSHNLAR